MTPVMKDFSPPTPRYCPWCGSEIERWGHDDDCNRPAAPISLVVGTDQQQTQRDAALARAVAAEEALSFARLREANVTRCKRWHPGFLSEKGDDWTGADWSNAMCGEAGETANVVKKLRRLEIGTAPGPDDPPAERLREMLADEIADTVTYADLLAAHYGIDLAQAVAAKFNRVSERQGFPDRLATKETP